MSMKCATAPSAWVQVNMLKALALLYIFVGYEISQSLRFVITFGFCYQPPEILQFRPEILFLLHIKASLSLFLDRDRTSASFWLRTGCDTNTRPVSSFSLQTSLIT